MGASHLENSGPNFASDTTNTSFGKFIRHNRYCPLYSTDYCIRALASACSRFCALGAHSACYGFSHSSTVICASGRRQPSNSKTTARSIFATSQPICVTIKVV